MKKDIIKKGTLKVLTKAPKGMMSAFILKMKEYFKPRPDDSDIASMNKGLELVNKLEELELDDIDLGKNVAYIVCNTVMNGVEEYCKSRTIISQNDEIAFIGYRFFMAREDKSLKNKADFGTRAAFLNYLNSKIAVDETMVNEQEDDFRFIGMLELSEVIEEVAEIEISADFLFTWGRANMQPEEVDAIIEAFRSEGYTRVDIDNYFKNNLKKDENRKITKALISTMKKYYGKKTETEIIKRLDDMKQRNNDNFALKRAIEKDLEETKRTGRLPRLNWR
jgi:uncharacterized protein YeeX (DUF496 family)